MIILGIETSCDDTGIAVYDSKKNKILANILHSQTRLHNEYGGIIPELASRDHIQRLLPLAKKVIKDAKISISDLNGVAYTAMPGLIGSLFVGASFAKTIAFMLNIPAISVHHLEGHIMSPFLTMKMLDYPFISLIISGGHTQLIQVNGFNNYCILGESVDDAAGEAFDKVARVIGLPYPGGPSISKIAEKGKTRFYFTRPMCKQAGLNFSFSGLKTAVLNIWKKHNNDQNIAADIACSFQEAIIDTIVIKCERALKKTNIKKLIIVGGVSANQHLRTKMQEIEKKNCWTIYFPSLEYCTDNGAMIAIAGAYRMQQGWYDQDHKIRVKSQASL